MTKAVSSGVLGRITMAAGLFVLTARIGVGIFITFMSMWLPMLVFEVVLGPWLLIKGVAMPASRPDN